MKIKNFKNFKKSKKLFTTNRNADFVEALMEFGALVCKPKTQIVIYVV